MHAGPTAMPSSSSPQPRTRTGPVRHPRTASQLLLRGLLVAVVVLLPAAVVAMLLRATAMQLVLAAPSVWLRPRLALGLEWMVFPGWVQAMPRMSMASVPLVWVEVAEAKAVRVNVVVSADRAAVEDEAVVVKEVVEVVVVAEVAMPDQTRV